MNQAPMTSPAAGCVLLEQLRHNGQFLPGFDERIHKIFKYAQQRVKEIRMPAFLDTVERTKKDEPLDFTMMKPPYAEQWIEIGIGGEVRFGYYVINVERNGVDFVEITAYHPGNSRCPDKPQGTAAVQFRLDKDGTGVISGITPVFTNLPGTSNAWAKQIVFQCVKVLQVMAAINVGFAPVIDANENNANLPRAARRLAAGRRYHVLTLRDTKAIKAGQKIVQNPGSMPLNTARGHWSRYGIDGRGLLFGRFTGRYWVPSHARGRAANGIVDKDYKLAPAAGKGVNRVA